MKKIFSLTTIAFLLISCNESFKEIRVDDFNKKIKDCTDIKNGNELIILFDNYPKEESKPNYQISSESKNGIYEIILIHNHIPDDSVASEKTVMSAKRNKNGSWTVLKILKSWKCRKGRGHKDWGVDICS